MDEVKIYVDGSYEPDLNIYGYGFVALLPDNKVVTHGGAGNNPDTARLRNVAGEMLGAMSAVSYAIRQGFSSVKLCYDYQGVENWATGVWKAKKPLTLKYSIYMKEQKKKIKISFEKIKAHSGDKFNEMADGIARQSVYNFAQI